MHGRCWQVDYIRAHEHCWGRHNRRRDAVTDHHAALVKFRHLTKPAGDG